VLDPVAWSAAGLYLQQVGRPRRPAGAMQPATASPASPVSTVAYGRAATAL
jgi:hypothetical protein